MLRHVWIATKRVPHQNGYVEKYICGVYPSAEVAEEWCLREGSVNGPYQAVRYADGDIYLEDASGHQRYVIQPHPITYRPPMKDPG